MGVLPRKWLTWIAIALGAAGMLMPALLEMGWIPRAQDLEALIFLMGFMVLDGAAAGESSRQVEAPELFDNPADYYHAISGLLPRTRHEYISIVRVHEIMAEQIQSFMSTALAAIKKEKNNCMVT